MQALEMLLTSIAHKFVVRAWLGIEVQAEYEVEGTDDVGEFTLGEHHCRKLTDEEIKEREARWEEEDAEG